MFKLIQAAVAFIIDPEARQKAPITFLNGNAMSVRDAKRYGLFYDGMYLTQGYLDELQDLALVGSPEDKARFLACQWNFVNRGLPIVGFIKSELEGIVWVQSVGAAFYRGENAFISLETIGEVLLSRIKYFDYSIWASKPNKFIMRNDC